MLTLRTLVETFVLDLYRKHWNTWFFVDGANRAFVNLMKVLSGIIIVGKR